MGVLETILAVSLFYCRLVLQEVVASETLRADFSFSEEYDEGICLDRPLSPSLFQCAL